VNDEEWEIQAMSEEQADEDAQREEEAADLANDITDAAQTLIEQYGWEKEDVIAHVRAVLNR